MAARQRKYVVEQQDIDEPEHDAFSEVQHDTESPVTASGPEGQQRTTVEIEMTQVPGETVPDLQAEPPRSHGVSFSRFASYASTTLGHDEIHVEVLEDVDIDMVIPIKLSALEFPKAEDGHEEDVAKVIRKSFSKLGLPRTNPHDALSSLAKGGLSLHLSWQAQVETAVEHQGEEFWQRVVQKTQTLNIGKTEAIFEVYTDLLVEKAGSTNLALLWVLKQDFKEFCTELFVIRLLQRGASVSTAGRSGNTPLHLAATKGFTNVARKLLERGAIVMAKNNESKTSLELAVEFEHNDFAVLMVKSMEPSRVRELFQGSDRNVSKLSLHALLEHKDMQRTVLAVLDTFMEPLLEDHNTFLVHYNILDGDTNGRPPSDPLFDKSTKSCLHKIAKSNNKEVVYHDVVRLLLRRKWKKFAKYVFFVQFLYFLLTMLSLTGALVLAARKEDPREYDDIEDIFRGVCEGISLILIGYNGITELNQLRIHKLHYFLDYFNYLDAPAVMFTFFIIPFRGTGLDVQWVFASLSYLFNGLRAFKYAAVFRSTGAYVQILFKIMLQDMIQFGTIFLVFLFSFSGAFYLALRGEVRGDGEGVMGGGNDTNATQEEEFTTSLDIYPFETAELYNVLFTGMRVMIEGGSIVDQYFGPDGFLWLGVIIYLVFLFLVIVILLNLLIAQMADTYSSVQQDAQRSLTINRAWIVARVEHNSLLARDYRKQFYKSCEVIKNPNDVLERWEVPPINEVNRKLERIDRAVRKQEEALEDLRSTILERLTQQDQLLEELMQRRDRDSNSSHPYTSPTV